MENVASTHKFKAGDVVAVVTPDPKGGGWYLKAATKAKVIRTMGNDDPEWVNPYLIEALDGLHPGQSQFVPERAIEELVRSPKGKRRNTQPGRPGYLADPRLSRENEVIGGGFIIFRRGSNTSRIRCPEFPFEHGSYDAAAKELKRLQAKHPNSTFQIFAAVR